MEIEQGQRPISHNQGVSGQIIAQRKISGSFEVKRKEKVSGAVKRQKEG